jgi:APA family basic amino acid/polyamine antiporter
MAQIFVRKSLETLKAEASDESPHGDVKLNRALSMLNLIALGIGNIIGAGIFVLTGQAAAVNAGPAITLSYVVGAIVAGLSGLCYAELASTIPIAGSSYTYAYATLGELVAWIIGWDLILEYGLGATTVAIGWSGYVVSFLKDYGIVVPSAYSRSPFTYDAARHAWHTSGAIINLPAMAVIAIVATLLVLGIRKSATVNNVIVAIKLVIVVLFLAATAPYVSTSHWVTANNPAGHFIPPSLGPDEFGWGGIVRGAAVIFFAYLGFDAVSRTRHADRHLGANWHLHGSLFGGWLCADRHRWLRQAQCTRSNCSRHRCRWAQLARTHREARHHPRADISHSRGAIRSTAHLIRHGA